MAEDRIGNPCLRIGCTYNHSWLLWEVRGGSQHREACKTSCFPCFSNIGNAVVCSKEPIVVNQGSRNIPQTLQVTMEKLKAILAAANCEVVDTSDHHVSFRHGTYMTGTASLLPKTATIELQERGNSTDLNYSVDTSGPAKWWLMFVGIIFCWAIFPPILVYRTLVYHPRRFMENIIAGV